MAVGETLLKITDYPFAYSLIGILALWSGIDVPDDKFAYLLAVSGSVGTLLVISNPIGRYLVNTLIHNFKRRKNPSFQTNKQNNFKYCIRAIETNSIKTEINKIVSLMYFAIIISFFGFAVGISDTVSEKLVFFQENDLPLCDSECLQLIVPNIALFFLIILIVVLVKDWPKIIRYAEIAGIYQLSISSEYVTSASRSSMERAVGQNDWSTAEEWAKIIENEIETEKGKRDFNIESVRQVYRPLYEESISINSTAQNIINNNTTATFPSGEWGKITSTTLQLMVKDQSLISKLNHLYDKIQEYNQYPRNLERQIQQIIQEEATKFYGKHVESVTYWFEHNGGGSGDNLIDSLRTGIHPLKRHVKPHTSRYIGLQISNMESEPLRDEKALANFEKLWELMLNRVRKETMSTKLQDLAKEIQKLNDELKPVFEERIRKQWA